MPLNSWFTNTIANLPGETVTPGAVSPTLQKFFGAAIPQAKVLPTVGNLLTRQPVQQPAQPATHTFHDPTTAAPPQRLATTGPIVQSSTGAPLIGPGHNADATTYFDRDRYKGTPEQRLAQWRKEVDIAVEAKRKQLSERLSKAQSEAKRLGTLVPDLVAKNAEDHKNYDAFVKSTLQARLDSAHGDPGLMWGADVDSIMTEFPFDSWARVPDATLKSAQRDFATATDNSKKWGDSLEVDWQNADNGMYKQIDTYTAEYEKYKKWDEDYRKAQSGNDIASKEYEHERAAYEKLAGEWQTFLDADAKWKAQATQLNADIAAGKYRVQNAWKLITSGNLTPGQRDALMAELEKGNVNPDIGVPDLGPQPTPPATELPGTPPTPPQIADLPALNLDPGIASFLGVEPNHGGVAATQIAAPTAITPAAAEQTPLPDTTPQPWAAPTSTATTPTTGTTQTAAPSGTPPWEPGHVPTLAEAQAYVYPTTPGAPKATPTPKSAPAGTPAPAPTATGAEAAGTTPPAEPTPTGGAEAAGTSEGAAPAESGNTGAISAGTNAPTQREVGAGTPQTNAQGSTQQTLDQASSTPAPTPQSTPGALAKLTSGAAIEEQGGDDGQSDGSAGQATNKDEKTSKPQTTPPSILAPFQKQAEIEKTPESQDAWA